MNIFNPLVSGSLSVSGSGQVSGDLTVLGTLFATISGTAQNAISTSHAASYLLTSSFETRTGSFATTGSNYFKGEQTFSGSLIPSGSELFDLGSSTNRWRDIFLAGSTINLGGTKLTKDGSGNIEIKDSNNNLKNVIASEVQIGEGDNAIIIKRDPSTGYFRLAGQTQPYIAAQLSGSFTGSGAGLYDIPASGVTGLNLNQISDGSATASISQVNGLLINTNTEITGNLKVNNINVGTNELVTISVTDAGGKYFIDNVRNPQLTLVKGFTYKFLFPNIGSHPLKFSTTNDGSHNGGTIYSTGVTTGATPNYIQIEVTDSTPSTLYYYCTVHPGMGSSISVVSDILNLEADRGVVYIDPARIATTGSNSFTGLQTISGSLSVTGSVDITGSMSLNGQPIGTGKLDETVFNSYTSSNNNKVSALETSSGSLNVFTSSIEQFTGSVNGKLNSLESSTSSLYSFTSSANSILSSLESASGSIRTDFNSYTSSNDSTNTTQNSRLSSLESASGSIRTDFNSYTSSNATTNTTQNDKLSSLETTSGSINSYTSSNITNINAIHIATSSLNTFSSSVLGAVEITGSNLTVKGNLLVKGTTTQIDSTTLNIGDNIIQLNGTAASNAGLVVQDASGASIISGSLLWDSATDNWKAGKLGSEERIILVNEYNTFSTSIDSRASSIQTATASLNSYTASNNTRLGVIETTTGSLNSFTSSANSRLNSLESASSSIRTDFNSYTSSTNSTINTIHTSTSSLNSYTSSNNTRLGTIESTTGSLNTYTSSANTRFNTIESTTASLNSFTNSINTTIKDRLNVESIISGSAQVTLSNTTGYSTFSSSLATTDAGQDNRLSSIEGKTGSYATTGSNIFIGNQTITGSLYVSQDLIIAGSSSIQHISSSVVNIADNIITVNAQNPSIRFGGLAVIDSGSSPQVSGSMLFDSTNDQWIFVHQNQGAITSSVLLMGPESFNNLGGENYLTQNRLPKGSGIEHLYDSNITDTGTKVSINSNTEITGTLAVTQNISSPNITAIQIATGSLNNFSSSILTAIELTGSNLTVKGNLLVKGTTTNVNVTTLDVDNNLINLNGTGATNAGLRVKDTTGPNQVSGSLLWDASNDYWIAGQLGSEQRIVRETEFNNAVTRIGNVETSTGSLNSYTSSTNTRLGVIESTTSSLNNYTSSNTTNINAIHTATSSLNSYTSSNTTAINAINTATSSLNTFTSSFNSAFSLSGADVTVRGNFTVSGTTTTVNSTTVNIADNIIQLNGTGATNAGLVVRDATASTLTSGSLLWDTSNDKWIAGPLGSEDDVVLRTASQTLTNKTINASQLVDGSVSNTKLANSSFNIGTTSISLGRASASQTLTGVSVDGNAGTVTNGVYTTGDQTIGGTKTFSANIINSATADWYMYGFGARGASSGAYGMGLASDIANRTLSFHVPNLAAYSNSGNTPKFGWYSNGAVELMTLQSATGNLVVTGTINGLTVSSGTISSGTWNGSSIGTAYTAAKVTAVNAGTGVGVDTTTGSVTVSIGQSVATTATPTFDQVITSNNGNGTNFRIGDDVWIGDINAANTFRIQGVQNAANGYIVFGNGDTTALGRASTGALTYGGNVVYHAGNIPTWNQSTTGNAATATILATARNIGGVSFNGSANIDLPGVNTAGNQNTTGNAATATEVIRTVSAGSEANLLYSTIADNDFFRIRVGGASNSGFVEIATADDATEPIHVRQYSGTFSTLTRTATLLDASGNTSFPGTVTAPTFSGVASSITNQANSATITASTGVDVNNIVRRDANGYIYANHVNFNTSESENPTISSFITSNGDGWSRKSSLAHVRNQLGNYGSWISGNQTITISGDASGSGATSISLTVSQIQGRAFRNTGSNDGVNANSLDANGTTYVTNVDGSSTNLTGNATDGALYSQVYSSSWQHQIYGDYRTGIMYARGKNNGTWQSWKRVALSNSTTFSNVSSVSFTHNLGTANLTAQVFDSSNNMFFPSEINITSTTVTVTFAANRSGRLVVTG